MVADCRNRFRKKSWNNIPNLFNNNVDLSLIRAFPNLAKGKQTDL